MPARVSWSAVLRQRCPRCRRGRVFGGIVRMHRACPECGLAFEREAGYFLGAMYFSYGLAVAFATPLVLALLALTDLSMSVVGWIAGAELLLLAPWLFRLSRVVWLHFDQRFDPR